jgi:D-xylose transport system substrate-binding protein
MLPNMGNKRYAVERDIFSSKVSGNGGEVIFYSADNDANKQESQLSEMLATGVDIVVLDPVNRFTAAGMVRMIHERGIKVISYDRLIANAKPDAFVSFNGEGIGEKMASFAVSKLPQGNYVVFCGDKSDKNATWIREGFYKVLNPYINSGKIKISFEAYIENWGEADANNIMNKYLKLSGNTPDVILSSSDPLSKGCISALKRQNVNPSGIIITGQGAEPFACRYILHNQQSMTVYKPVKKLAELAADLSIKIAHGQKVDDLLITTINNGLFNIQSALLETQVVDSSKIRSIVMADGMLTEKELSE